MKSSRIASCVAIAAIAVLFSQAAGSSVCLAHETGSQHLHFKKPSQAARGSRVNQANLKFRSPSEESAEAEQKPAKKAVEVEQASYDEPVAKAKPRKKPTSVRRRAKVVSSQSAKPVRVAQKKKAIRRDRQVVAAAEEYVEEYVEYEPNSEVFEDMPMAFGGYQENGSYQEYGGCDKCGGGGCSSEVGCGMADPSCGFEGPGCGLAEPGCGLGEPSCGLENTDCGSCVGSPGKDYWCFPVCLPRFKDLSVWGGVHGFRGPRDFSNQRSDSNFGFQEGINISGRAPLVSLLFPQLSYQLGYQGVQSRLSGTATSTEKRNQHFVTGGLFRRVKTGL